MRKRILTALLIAAAILAACGGRTEEASDQAEIKLGDYSLTIASQDVRDGEVVIEQVEVPVQGWIVIQNASGGQPFEVIGYRELPQGLSRGLKVNIDAQAATATLFISLNRDGGQLGAFEYPGLDTPFEVDGRSAQVAFTAIIQGDDIYLTVYDQEISTEEVEINEVYTDQPPIWVAIYNDDGGTLGEVIGQEWLDSQQTEYVIVNIDLEQATPILYAMMHKDAGEIGVFEYPGPDEPVVIFGEQIISAFNVTLP